MKILIADDHMVYREVLKTMLRPYGECVVVEDGEQAVLAFEEALQAKEPFSLVLLDIQMPHMDGQEALLQMRQMEKRVYGPTLDIKEYACIIMQTSVDDPRALITAFKKGHCNGFINKPVDKEELLDKMKRHGLI
ncbi:MAG: response regulator [Magnetococcales bacterium]|nr:response regulator [Magnetococcales bacterium]